MIDLCKGSYGTPLAGITYPLLDSYRRRQTRDHIYVWSLKDSHILSDIWCQTFKVSALTFSKEDIKGKGRLS